MNNYDKLYDVAADNYGLVSRAQARELGVSDKELSRLASDGRLTRLGNEEPNLQSFRSIHEADEILANGGTGKAFDSGRALLDAVRHDAASS